MPHSRVLALRKALNDLDAIAVSSAANRFYLSGFASSAGTVLVTREGCYFLVDSRYIEAAEAAIPHMDVLRSNQPIHRDLAALCVKLGVRRMGFEDLELTVATHRLYAETMTGIELVPIGDAVIRARRRKDAAEQALIRQAQRITDLAFSDLLGGIRAGMTERDCARILEDAMMRHGATGLAFPTIAVAGKNSSRPHGVPSDYALQVGDFITMDFGAVYNGYRSDMTRTLAIGQISDEMRLVYETVLKAQQAAIEMARPGIPCSEIDKVARDIITQAGYGDCFGHSLGHSFGIDIHESPRFAPGDHSLLEPGVCVTVEPGIYLAGRFGVRIEDDIILTQDGCEDITSSPKQLLVV